MAQESDAPRKRVWKVSDCPLVSSCEQKWDDLHLVPNEPKMRYCTHCRQAVYRCETETEFREHRALGHCIAIEVELPNKTRTIYLGGAPKIDYDPGKQLDWD